MRMRTKQVVTFTLAGLCALLLPVMAPGDNDREVRPTGKGIGTLEHPGNSQAGGQGKGKPGGGGGTGIDYHNGPLMTGQVNVYYIWYGNWSGNTAKTILEELASKIGGSPYYNINTTYSVPAYPVDNSVQFVRSIDVGLSHGTKLTDNTVQTIVAENILSGLLPPDPQGVFFVLTSADVANNSGFCTQYCGWHSYQFIGNSAIKYSFVGNAARCPSACAEQSITSPNGNIGADAMASVIAHELEEAATDPTFSGWYSNTNGMENADKCAWTFGTTYRLANGSKANMKLGGRDFLIQQNWLNTGSGSCALSYP